MVMSPRALRRHHQGDPIQELPWLRGAGSRWWTAGSMRTPSTASRRSSAPGDWTNGNVTSKHPRCANPWKAVQRNRSGQYVLEDDRPYVEAFNAVPGRKDKHLLRTDLLPEPFTGPRDAPVVVLFLNPGVGGEEESWHERPEFVEAVRATLGDDPVHHRHLGLDDRFADTGGGQWTRRAFRAVRDELGCPFDDLADKVLSVEFHGYHSREWLGLPVTLPSQRYSFSLVEQAVSRGAVVVAMRGRSSWTVAVPALGEHTGLLPPPRSAQVSALSRKNLGDEPFKRLAAALG